MEPGLAQVVLYLLVLLILVKPLGTYIARVYSNERTSLDRLLGPVERLLYRLAGSRGVHRRRAQFSPGAGPGTNCGAIVTPTGDYILGQVGLIMLKRSIFRAVILMLLSFGLFQIIASIIAFIFLMLAGHWTDYVPQIAILAFALTLPIGYLVWKKYFEEKFSS